MQSTPSDAPSKTSVGTPEKPSKPKKEKVDKADKDPDAKEKDKRLARCGKCVNCNAKVRRAGEQGEKLYPPIRAPDSRTHARNPQRLGILGPDSKHHSAA